MVNIVRPTKAVNTLSKNLTKEEKENRIDSEEKLKGKSDKIYPSEHLSPRQVELFNYIVEELKESKILSNLDVYLLDQAAVAIDRLQRIEKLINKRPSMMFNKEVMATKDKYTKDFFRCCTELSLSPQSRAKIANINKNAKEDEEDPVKAALADDDE